VTNVLKANVLLLALIAGMSNAATYEISADGSDIVGNVTSVAASFEDTLIDIARRHGLGYQDIVRANPDVDVWVPGEGTEVILPTHYVLPPGPREGIVLNLAEYRLYYFPQPSPGQAATVMTFPISIGRMDWETPLGMTTIISKVVNPAWYPPQSVRDEHAAEGRPLDKIVLPGPDNPLGKYALRLDLPGYLIHGTNRPAGVGMRVTHGCLRMFPEDIEHLFKFVHLNMPVRIINEPVKIGWEGDNLVMEVHPVLEAAPTETTDEPVRNTVPTATSDDSEKDTVDDVDVTNDPEKDPLAYVTEQFVVATSERPGQLEWLLVEEVVERADGMPVAVGQGIKNAAASAASD